MSYSKKDFIIQTILKRVEKGERVQLEFDEKRQEFRVLSITLKRIPLFTENKGENKGENND